MHQPQSKANIHLWASFFSTFVTSFNLHPSRTKSILPSTNDPSLFPWLLVHVRQNVICIGGSVHVLLPDTSGRALSVSAVTIITKHFFCCSLKAVRLFLRALSHNITNQFSDLRCERGLITQYYSASPSETTKKGDCKNAFCIKIILGDVHNKFITLLTWRMDPNL